MHLWDFVRFYTTSSTTFRPRSVCREEIRNKVDHSRFSGPSATHIPRRHRVIQALRRHSLLIHIHTHNFNPEGSTCTDRTRICVIFHDNIISPFDQHPKTYIKRISVPARQGRRPIFVGWMMHHLCMLFKEGYKIWFARSKTVL